MAQSISLRCDVAGLIPFYENTTAKARAATAMAGTSALRAMRAEGSRRVRDKKGIQASKIDSAIVAVFPSSKEVFVWSLIGKAKPIPLIAFNARQTGRGVSVEVTKGRRLVVAHAFIATMASGHKGVFLRRGNKQIMQRGRYAGKKRQPIYEAFSASVAPALGEAAQRVMARGQSVFRDTFNRTMRPR